MEIKEWEERNIKGRLGENDAPMVKERTDRLQKKLQRLRSEAER
jgi:hypothetical protein